jgi:SEC-C motif
LKLRARFGEKINAMNELTLLGLHLSQNLWVDDQYDMVMVDESIAASLDAAMMVRREGVKGPDTPPGILTRFRGTVVERFLGTIEREPHPAPLELGLLLLELGEDTIKAVNDAWGQIVTACQRDGRAHDATIGFGAADQGLTLQGNFLPEQEARILLGGYCARRKYAQRSDQWFGMALDPDDGSPRFVISVEGKWAEDPEMDGLVAGMAKGRPFRGKFPRLKTGKPGRNAPCPCGSGLKFKKCCL